MAEQPNGKQKDPSRKPDFKTRQMRKKASGNTVKAFGAVVFLGLGVGAYIERDLIMATFMPPNEPVVIAKKAPAPPPVEERPIEKKVEPPPVEKAPAPAPAPKVIASAAAPSFSTSDETAAAKLLADGKALLEKFQFTNAQTTFKQAMAKQASPATRESAKVWARKAELFEVATHHIPISPYAAAETTYVIQTRDGEERTGLIKSENDEQVVFQQVDNPASLGQAFLPIPKSDIAKMTPCPLAQRQDDFMRLLGSLEEKVNIQRSTDYYDLVFLSKRLGLGRACIEYLNRAYNGGPEHAPDPYLDDSFRKELVHREIDRASLLLASGRKPFAEMVLNDLVKKKLPNYGVAQDEVDAFRLHILSKYRDDFKSTFKEVKKVEVASAKALKTQSAKQLASENDPVFEVDNSGVQGKGAAGPVVEKANTKYDEGMRLYRGFKQGTNGNNNQALEAAMKSLTEAVDLYDEALKKDPGNKTVADRQLEANMIVYACKKYHTL